MISANRPVHRLLLGSAAASMLLAGCDAEAAGGPRSVRRDSAGVAIVENIDANWADGSAWSLSDTPSVRIGTEAGPEQYRFTGIRGVSRMANGDIVVADGGSHTIRFYTSDGDYRDRVGREGAGPGEYRHISLFRLIAGDSLLIWDQALRRATILSPSGQVSRIVEGPSVAGFFLVRDAFPDGSLLGMVFPGLTTENAQPGVLRPPVTFVRYDFGSRRLDTIVEMPGARTLVSGEGVISIPFEADPVATTDGNIVHVGPGDAFEIRSFTETGKLLRILRLDRPRSPLDEEIIRQRMEEMIAASRRPDARERIERTYGDLPYAPYLPAYEAMLVDADSNLWVGGYTVSDSQPTRWTVFDPAGRILGSLETPAAFSAYQVGTDYILGVATDSLGVEQVQVLGIDKEG